MIPILDIFTGVVTGVKGILDKFIPDANLKVQAQAELDQMIHQSDMTQLLLDMKEADSESFFVKGWRPAVGWMGVAGLGFQTVIAPVLGMFGLRVPAIDTGTLTSLLVAMLGMGGLRSFDKYANKK